VTGATDGLGRRVALELAAKSVAVLLHGRHPERLEAKLQELRRETGSEKLGCFSEYDRLDVLVNNAGIISREREESENGFELTFAVNHLSHFLLFLLAGLLVPVLRHSAPSRVVNVASAAQSPIDFLDDPLLERGYDAMKAYSHSKLAQVMFTFELAERLSGTGVSVNALHPASLMDTRMVRETFGYTMSTVEEGAEAVGLERGTLREGRGLEATTGARALCRFFLLRLGKGVAAERVSSGQDAGRSISRDCQRVQ
jgi:NAD(P)-dependent dehydrogenase (short-subunit alcohol dehydrogenase family)